jgi:hypothetical protein
LSQQYFSYINGEYSASSILPIFSSIIYKNYYCEITFIRGVPIFVVFVGRLIHEIKNPMNNETWEAV